MIPAKASTILLGSSIIGDICLLPIANCVYGVQVICQDAEWQKILAPVGKRHKNRYSIGVSLYLPKEFI